MEISTKNLVLCAVFAAVISLFSVVTVPTGIVPVTLGVFGVLFASVVLGAKRAFVSVLVFILIGAVGIPVFSGMKGGAGVIFGPTGGYITSYIFMALIAGAASSKMGAEYSKKSFFVRLLGCIAALAACYLLGTVQYVFVADSTFFEALLVCVYPFVVFDLIKCVLAVILGEQARKRLPR